MAAAHEAVAPTSGHHRVREIEGLRAVAAGLVVVFHLSAAVNTTHPGLVSPDAIYWIARFGPLGVAIFFVLSGYLLYSPFASAALAGLPSPNLTRYYVRRFARIFPAYWVAVTVYLFVVGPNQVHGVADAAEFLGLAQNYHAGNMLRGLGVAWTLVIEVSFYVVLPVIAWILRGPRSAHLSANARLRRQLCGLAVIYCAGVASRFVGVDSRSLWVVEHHLWRPHRYLDLWLPGFLDWFALGMLLAVLGTWHQAGHPLPRWVATLTNRLWISWAGAFVVYWTLQQANFPTTIGTAYTVSQVMIKNTLMPIAGVLIVLPVALGAGNRGLLRSVLRTRPFVTVGVASYGVYLWHVIWIRQTVVWMAERTIPRSATLQMVLVFGFTAISAATSYFVIERPFIRWSSRVGRRVSVDRERAAAPLAVGS